MIHEELVSCLSPYKLRVCARLVPDGLWADARLAGESLPRDVTDAIRGLWHDQGVREAVRRSREFQVSGPFMA